MAVVNLQNYYAFAELIETGKMVLDVRNVTIQTWNDYYTGLDSIIMDGIESHFIQNAKVKVIFVDGVDVDLSLFDLSFNIILWHLLLKNNLPITSEYLFFGEAITQDEIKDFIDMVIDKVKRSCDSVELNRSIADTLQLIPDTINKYSEYLANTINMFDTIKLAEANPEFKDCLNASFRDIPIEEVKDAGMKVANKSIDIIKNSEKYLGYDHCLKNSFLSQQGINPRQYKEFAINIGTKPDGTGGVHPAIIDTSYIKGMSTIQHQFMDSSSARVAQIQTKENVGNSGSIARILGINNITTYLHDDLNYKCNTQNFIKIEMKNKQIFKRFIDRYYRFTPNDIDHYLTSKDTHVIGKTLYFRSPVTCASAAAGHGVCAACYGGLANINKNISIGKFAAEQLTSQLTQRLLSSKHLLETSISKTNWSDIFRKYFVIDFNGIYAIQPSHKVDIIINQEDITYLAENDNYQKGVNNYSAYITSFTIVDSDGRHEINSAESTELYIDENFEDYIKHNAKILEDGSYKMSLNDIAEKEILMFLFRIDNNELVKTLKVLERAINLKNTIEENTKDSLIQYLIEMCIKGKVTIQSIHMEVLVSNQIRAAHSNISKPDWEIPDVEYKLLTLDHALKDNPSIIISLLYKDLSKVLSNPNSFKKHEVSTLDPFFMTQPQNLLIDKNVVLDPDKKEMINPIIRLPKQK